MVLHVSVLATLVKNKLVPDPFYGLENESILDIADSGREYYTFWFFTTFECKLVCGTLACRNLVLYTYSLVNFMVFLDQIEVDAKLQTFDLSKNLGLMISVIHCSSS